MTKNEAIHSILPAIGDVDPSKTLDKRCNLIILTDCTMGILNGDPDAAGAQRYNARTGRAYVTDYCFKHKVRSGIETLTEDEPEGYALYIRGDSVLNDKDREALVACGYDPDAKDFDKKLKTDLKGASDAVAAYMCKKYFDIRTFGAVLTSMNKLDLACSAIRGSVQFGVGQTVDRIDPPHELSLTRSVVATQKEFEDHGMKTMGNKAAIIDYGLFRTNGTVDGMLTKRYGFTYGDLALMLRALSDMFLHDAAAARANCNVRKLVLCMHDSDYGNASDAQLERIVQTKKLCEDVPACYEDYEVTVHPELAPAGVRVIEIV